MRRAGDQVDSIASVKIDGQHIKTVRDLWQTDVQKILAGRL